MTSEEFIKLYPEWLHLNGIEQAPEIGKAQIDQIPGMPIIIASTEFTWYNSRGKMQQSDGYMLGSLDEPMREAFQEVQAFTRGTMEIPATFVHWSEFLNPKPPPPGPVSPVGLEVPRTIVEMQARLGGRIDGSKRYFYVNASIDVAGAQTETIDGKKLITVSPGPFIVWWMLR